MTPGAPPPKWMAVCVCVCVCVDFAITDKFIILFPLILPYPNPTLTTPPPNQKK